MSLKDFFAPVVLPGFSRDSFYNSQFGKVWQIHTSELPVWNEENKPHLAIIGVEEERPSVGNAGTAKGPDAVRRHLYQLYQGDYPVKVVDLGNIKAGHAVEDTYAALQVTVETLIKQDIIPIILGGGQDLTYAQYKGYESLEPRVEVAVVASCFDLDQDNAEDILLNSKNYLNKILLHQP